MPKKANKAQAEQRVKHIYNLLLLEKSREEILQDTIDWQLSEGMIDKYIAKATARLQERSAKEMETARQRSRARWLRLIEKAYSAGDLRAVASAQSSLDKVDGVNAPDKIEHSGNITWKQFIDEAYAKDPDADSGIE